MKRIGQDAGQEWTAEQGPRPILTANYADYAKTEGSQDAKRHRVRKNRGQHGHRKADVYGQAIVIDQLEAMLFAENGSQARFGVGQADAVVRCP